MKLRSKSRFGGFTLIELMVGLMISAIIMSAVASFAYAFSTGNESTKNISEKQAQVRIATLRIAELIKHCKLICSASSTELAIWRADDNDDNQINAGELVYLEMGNGKDYVRLLEFSASEAVADVALSMDQIGGGSVKSQLINVCDENYAVLLPECVKVEFLVDVAAPWSRLVSVLFWINEDGEEKYYEVNAWVRGWAGNLLNSYGQKIASDDD